MRLAWKDSGFTLIELMVVLAILAIAAGFSAPHLQKWMHNYRLKGAVMDLRSDMQLAKTNAVKENRPWLLDFDAGGTYRVIQCLTNTCTTGTEDTDWRVAKTVNLKTTYGDEIVFYTPDASPLFPSPALTFQRDGTTNPSGFAYIANATHSSCYRVGTQFIAGAVRIQRWTGSDWE
jgi:type IV fimbrial biogenesis protein FimT